MSIKVQAHPSMEQMLGWAGGTDLQNEARNLENQGDFAAAESKYLEAIRDKEAGFGPDHYTTGTSYDSLGDLYLKMERIDKAEEYLNKALRARENSGFPSDLAMTRDNLGKLYEMKDPTICVIYFAPSVPAASKLFERVIQMLYVQGGAILFASLSESGLETA